MKDACSSLFNLHNNPSYRDIRQLWTTLINIIFQDQKTKFTDYISCPDDIALQSEHSAKVHDAIYSSVLNGKWDADFRLYHQNLGAESPKIDPFVDHTIQTEQSVLDALCDLYGNGASFKSQAQKQMCENIIRPGPDLKHMHVNMPCGHGKSLAWLLPSYLYRKLDMAHVTQFVICPYNFLTNHHYNSALKFFDNIPKSPSCAVLLGSDIQQRILPNIFASNTRSLPHIIYFTVDAIHSLMKYHEVHINRLCKSGKIKNIFIDEIQTIIEETSFRECYEILPTLCSLGVRIITLSGSLPLNVSYSILTALKMSQSDNPRILKDAVIIDGGDPIGDGFYLEAISDDLPHKRTYDLICDFKKHHPKSSCHTIVSCVKVANQILALFNLKNPELRVEVITSKSSKLDINRVSREWFHGSLDVLITTTAGLVGNECYTCKSIIVVGNLFSISCITQAIGRLRPKQRGDYARVTIIAKPMTDYEKNYHNRKDKEKLDVLIKCGLLSRKRSVIDAYKKVFTMQSIVLFFNEKIHCRKQVLSEAYGYSRSPCLQCDICLASNHILRCQQVCQKEMKDQDVLTQKAREILDVMRRKCYVCKNEACDGFVSSGNKRKFCLNTKFQCFNCGGNHYRQNCNLKLNKLLNFGACYSCFGPHEIFHCQSKIYDSTDGKKSECVIKKRLRALFIRETIRKKTTLQQVLQLHAINKRTFYKFIVNFKI